MGRTIESNAVAEAGTAAHSAAQLLLDAGFGQAAAVASRHRDGFAYDIVIADDTGTELMNTSFRDPVPDQLAALLAALADHPPSP